MGNRPRQFNVALQSFPQTLDGASAVNMSIGRIAAMVSIIVFGSLSVRASAAPATSNDEVWAAERAFARTMADRDFKRFGDFVSTEAIFFSETGALRGRAAVLEGWAKLFDSAEAPFSWEPDQVEVLESGTLALSTGLVRDPAGKVIARFNSIWRLEEARRWRVVFDKGSPPTPGPK